VPSAQCLESTVARHQSQFRAQSQVLRHKILIPTILKTGDKFSLADPDEARGFLTPEGHQNPIIGSKVAAILLKGSICLLVELYQEWSAPVACAAGLFSWKQKLYSRPTAKYQFNLIKISAARN
jgi:hypothetical protein